jgi:hypothetical protein
MHEHAHEHLHGHADLLGSLLDAGLHAVGISLFVFLMMVVVDYVNVWTDGRLTRLFQGGRYRQYVTAGVLGAAPGCLGSFLVVTMYIRGMLGFGALCACMVASSGDAAFIMLAEIPGPALLLFGVLFGLSLLAGPLVDLIARRLGMEPCAECQEHGHHVEANHCYHWPEAGLGSNWRRPHPLRFVYLLVVAATTAGVLGGVFGHGAWDWVRVTVLGLLAVGLFVVVTVPDEYLVEHLWQHVTRKHLPRIMAWTLGALLALSLAQHYLNLDALISGHMALVLLAAALVGLLPDSGPHLVFVFLFASGSVPFSVLLTSAIVQDGHGLLPLLSVSIKDALWVKAMNLVLGLAVGFAVMGLGY